MPLDSKDQDSSSKEYEGSSSSTSRNQSKESPDGTNGNGTNGNRKRMKNAATMAFGAVRNATRVEREPWDRTEFIPETALPQGHPAKEPVYEPSPSLPGDDYFELVCKEVGSVL